MRPKWRIANPQARARKQKKVREKQLERERSRENLVFPLREKRRSICKTHSINGGGHYLELGWVCLSVVLLFSFVCFSKGRKRSLSPNDSIRARKRVHTDITIRDKPTYHLSKHCTLKNRRIIILKMNSLSF